MKKNLKVWIVLIIIPLAVACLLAGLIASIEEQGQGFWFLISFFITFPLLLVLEGAIIWASLKSNWLGFMKIDPTNGIIPILVTTGETIFLGNGVEPKTGNVTKGNSENTAKAIGPWNIYYVGTGAKRPTMRVFSYYTLQDQVYTKQVSQWEDSFPYDFTTVTDCANFQVQGGQFTIEHLYVGLKFKVVNAWKFYFSFIDELQDGYNFDPIVTNITKYYANIEVSKISENYLDAEKFVIDNLKTTFNDEYGIDLVSVSFPLLRLGDSSKQHLELDRLAENEAKKGQGELERLQQEQIAADVQNETLLKRTKADAERRKIEAEAKAKALKIEGDAQAEINKLLKEAEVAGEVLKFAKKIETYKQLEPGDVQTALIAEAIKGLKAETLVLGGDTLSALIAQFAQMKGGNQQP